LSEIKRKHRPRDIHSKNDIDPACFLFGKTFPFLWTRQRNYEGTEYTESHCEEPISEVTPFLFGNSFRKADAGEQESSRRA
jgi:hypothetical protein